MEQSVYSYSGLPQRRSSIIHNLLERETCGKSLQRMPNPFGKSIPDRLNIPMESVLPIIALQNGHIFLGFTECGRFLLSYTIREEFENTYNRNEMAFFYKLHIWLFTPHKLAKRVGSVILFSNAGVADNNLLIDVSQWRNDDSKLVILGRNYSPENGGFRSLFYVTMTSLPSTSLCSDCSLQAATPDSEDTFDVHGLLDRGKCLYHSITTHLVYERVPPFPKFDFDVQLGWKNSIVLNTGNALHIFTYNVSGPRQESIFIPELLNPPHHPEPKKGKTRHLRCDFWFKLQSSDSLQKILSNCSPHEASRIHTTAFTTKTEKISQHEERNEDCITAQESLLSNLPLSMDLSPTLQASERLHSRRLSQSSVDSENSSVSRSTNLSYQSSQDNLDVQKIETEQPLPSPPKRHFLGNPVEVRKVMSSSMPPPPRRRKFFKTGQLVANARKSSPRITRPAPNPSNSSPKPEKTYDIFDVGVEEVLLERSLSSYRKRRNADKQYEFADPDVSAENLVPLKLSRKRARVRFPSGVMFGRGSKSPRSIEGSSPTHCSTNYEGLSLGPSGYPRSPRALTVNSPAISPNYAELGDILRPLTNYSNVNPMSPNPLFSPPPFTRDFCEDVSIDASKMNLRYADTAAGITTQQKYSRTRPTFTTNVNCMAKILRCYVDRDDDNLSVKTDTDDEFNVTVPFPVALNLDVHGSGYQSLQLIHNSKVKSSPTPVVEVLQRTLEVEILCNEVAGMICLSADKRFISCFDYDVAILGVCPKGGSITAVAVVLIHAVNLTNERKDLAGNESSSQTSSSYIPNLLDLRQKYEALFSFVWDAVSESCRILHVGHMREIETTPENWHPTKQILQRLEETSLSRTIGPKQRVLSNELAVFEWQSLDELVDSTGLIHLCSGSSSKLNITRGITSSNLTLANLDTEDEDDDLSD